MTQTTRSVGFTSTRKGMTTIHAEPVAKVYPVIPTPAMVDAALDSWCAPGWRNRPKHASFDRHAMSDAIAAAMSASAYADVLEALISVRKLISEAAATGFNYKDGDWSERLYLSQQKTSTAIAKATGESK
jgi:hypothetical protein